MTEWTALTKTLQSIEVDIRSEKLAIKKKALEQLTHILDNRSKDLCQLLRNYNVDITWNRLFDSCHQAIIILCDHIVSNQDKKGLALIESKCAANINAIQKIVNLANSNSFNISYNEILENAFQCFANRWLRKYFANCYLQMTNRNIFGTKGNFGAIRTSQWSTLLSHCFQMYDRESVQKLQLLQCINSVVEVGPIYSNLNGDLLQYLPKLEMICLTEKYQYNAQKELIKIIYGFCSKLAQDNRLAICDFMDNILSVIIKTYDPKMDADMKIVVFKILHLSIVLHNCDGYVVESADNSIAYARELDVWHKHLRNMYHLNQQELNKFNGQVGRQNTNICEYFLWFATSLSSVVFWNRAIWNETTDSMSSQSQKRRRGLDKVEGLLDMIEYEKGKYSWHWLAILSKLLNDHPKSLQPQDFQPILKMLYDIQLTIQHPIQISILKRIAFALLQREKQFLKEVDFIDKSFCNDLWYKIAQTAFRTSASNNLILIENIKLLKLLIINRHHTLPGPFLQSIMKTLLSNSIPKSNESVQLLVSMYRNVNFVTLDNAKELRVNTMNWLHQKSNQLELKHLINSNVVDNELIAELTVLCVFSKFDSNIAEIEEADDDTEYQHYILELRESIRFKLLKELIFIERKSKKTFDYNVLPQPNALQSIINEEHLQHLVEILQPEGSYELSDNSFEDIIQIGSSAISFLQILNKCIHYSALDKRLFDSLFFTKKLHIKIDQIEICMGELLKSMDLQGKDTLDILKKLLEIFSQNFHGILRDLLKSHKLSNTIKWIWKQTANEVSADSAIIEIVKYDSLAFEHKVRAIAFTLLAFFADGPNVEQAFEVISKYEFNFDSNTDLCIVYQLLQTMVKQTKTIEQSEWAFNCIKFICQKHYKSQHVSELTIDLLPDLIKIINKYPSMTDDLIVVVGSFLSQCKNRKYGPRLIEKLIRKLHFVLKAYPHLVEVKKFVEIFYVLHKFLAEEMLSIQFATIKTLSYTFDLNWIYDGEETEFFSLKLFHNNLFEYLKIEKLQSNQSSVVNGEPSTSAPSSTESADRTQSLLSVQIQLYAAIISTNYVLRKRCLYLLAELCYKNSIKAEQISPVFTNICKYLQMDHAEIINENIFHLISQWLINNLPMNSFPWYITPSLSQSDFFYDNIETITACLLRYKIELLDDFIEIMKQSHQTLIKPVLPNVLSYLIPMQADCRNVSPNMRENGKEIARYIKTHFGDLKVLLTNYIIEIVENVLLNLWDAEKFKEFFYLEIDVDTDDENIDLEAFNKSLDFKQSLFPSMSSEQNFLINLCFQQPYNIYVLQQRFKLKVQQTRFVEQKLIHFFQYCVLTEQVLIFLVREIVMPKSRKKETNHIKRFYVRDIIYFMCNLMLDAELDGKLKLATCRYFLKCCRQIVPRYMDGFETYLNYIVSTLVPLIKDNGLLSTICLECLQFLIVDNKTHLAIDIALLDSFPIGTQFDELRSTHSSIKYGGIQFSLLDEIEYFLKIDRRKIEGLIALKNHISSKKHELTDIYKSCQDMRFSEDCEKSVLHKLIFALLQMLQGSDVDKSIEAAKCLGELGPANLSTIVLKPDSQMQTYEYMSSFESAVVNLCKIAIEKLNLLLLHPDARVLTVVSDACRFLLKSKIGQNISENYPYLHIFHSAIPPNFTIYRMTNKTLNLKQIFDEEESSPYSVWIKRFTCELFDLFGDEHLRAVVSVQVLFAESMLPLLTQMLLACRNFEYNQMLFDVVATFFAKHFELQSDEAHNSSTASTSSTTSTIYLNKAAIKSMIRIVECIRIYNLKNVVNTIALNYLHIAKAAKYCEAEFTAILYSELWVLQQRNTNKLGSQFSDISGNEILQDIMKESYLSIGEMDAVIAFVDPIKSRLKYLQLNNSWNRIYIEHDGLMQNNQQNLTFYKEYLAKSGLYSLANSLSQQTDVQYECAWRLCDWNLIVDTTGTDQQLLLQTHDLQQLNRYCLKEFEKQHYLALKCLQTRDEMGVKAAIKLARQSIISFLKYASLECTNNIYKHLTALAMLQQIEDFCLVQFEKPDLNAGNIFHKWKYNVQCKDFQHKELILAQRVTIFQSAGIRATRKLNDMYNVQKDAIPCMILDLATESRLEGQHNLSIRYLASLNSKPISNGIRGDLILEDVQLNWLLGDQVLAKKLLNQLLSINDVESSMSRGIALRIYGEYLAETHAENVKVVTEKFFESSMTFVKNMKKNKSAILNRINKTEEHFDKYVTENTMKAYESIAKYADREYNRLTVYMKSENFQKKKSTVQKNRIAMNEIGKGEASKELSNEYKKSLVIMKKYTDIDREEIKKTEAEYAFYLNLTVQNYLKACTMNADDNSTSFIFRIVSLIFSNRDNSKLLSIFKEELPNIVSYKFLLVLPQIVPRLSNADDDFSNIITSVVEKCATDHPHHTLYHILALSNAYTDDNSHLRDNPEPRVLGAAKLIDKLQKNKKIGPLVRQMETMCTALIELANKKLKTSTIPSDEPLSKLKDLQLIHCPTLNLPISKTCDYSKIISVHRWGKEATGCGGVNEPKKIKCKCDDGMEYPQLLKGRDDLRQDAVMQQVFTIMNEMLRSHNETKHRKLNVRTYKIVPLSQRSGILEWCANTIPMSEYLIGNPRKPGAHEIYYPDDLKPMDCRKRLECMKSLEIGKKVQCYVEMCTKITPAFQYFFLEKFHSPGVWFERRLAYTNSVATNSMIGYILGIGDRHFSNILIDERTAEVVHIDFGIAFEQAKCLPTPEQFPFRLTRDVVAGFGVTGVEGIFRKSSEKTMEVLRQNKSTIITILEVLLYDPLYMWALSTKKAYSRQSVEMDVDEDVNVNLLAERALLRLEAKLNGCEEGSSGQSTVEATVDTLIMQATSPYNLCQAFSGWQPYL